MLREFVSVRDLLNPSMSHIDDICMCVCANGFFVFEVALSVDLLDANGHVLVVKVDEFDDLTLKSKV